MLQGPLPPLLLVLSAAAVAPMPPPEHCESEMNKIKDLLQVSCVDKGLTSIPAGLPEGTGILLLGSNHLAQVTTASFEHLQQLSELDLSNNSLEALETSTALPKLQQLLLSHNRLESLPAFRAALPGLKRLALGHNGLSQLPEGGFRELGQLRDLELQGNRLEGLPAGAFTGLAELRDLDLSGNLLEALPAGLLAGLPHLEILRLEGNRLRHVPDGFFSEEALYAYVYLAGNPWLCDCQLLYLRDWILENEISIYTRTSVQEQGSEKVVTENEPESVRCHAPQEEKGRPVMHFQAACKKLGDYEEAGDGDGGTADGTASPSTWTSAAALPLTTPFPVASRVPSHTPSTARPPTSAFPTTTSQVPTAAISVLTTPPAVATWNISTTGVTGRRSTATSNASTMTPGSSTDISSPTTPSKTISTTGVTGRRSTATSNASTMTPGSSTDISSPTAPSKTFRVPTTPTTTSSTPFTHRTTARMLPAPVPQRTPPPTVTVARRRSSTAALVPSTAERKSSPRLSAPASTRSFSPPPSSKPSARCLCPALPVRVLGVSAHQGSPAAGRAGHCCLLRLAMYIACLVLVVLPTLPLLCRLGWVYLSWYRPALQGAPGARLLRYQPWQRGTPKEWQLQTAEAPSPATGPRTYRVCKSFRIAPARHVTWLLVSLPGSARRWPREQRQDSPSSYSLDRGRDTIGAVRVKYAAASL